MWTHTHVDGEAVSQPIPAPPLAGPACGGWKWKAIPRWRVLGGIQRPALSHPMASEDRFLVREPEPDSLLMFNNWFSHLRGSFQAAKSLTTDMQNS